VLHYAVLYYTLLYFATLYYTVLCCADCTVYGLVMSYTNVKAIAAAHSKQFIFYHLWLTSVYSFRAETLVPEHLIL
jgi:hypothetical protein